MFHLIEIRLNLFQVNQIKKSFVIKNIEKSSRIAIQRVWKFENQNFDILRKMIELQFEWTDTSGDIHLID